MRGPAFWTLNIVCIPLWPNSPQPGGPRVVGGFSKDLLWTSGDFAFILNYAFGLPFFSKASRLEIFFAGDVASLWLSRHFGVMFFFFFSRVLKQILGKVALALGLFSVLIHFLMISPNHFSGEQFCFPVFGCWFSKTRKANKSQQGRKNRVFSVGKLMEKDQKQKKFCAFGKTGSWRIWLALDERSEFQQMLL